MDDKLKDLDIIQKALGNFVWLGNNLHNFHTADFFELLKTSIADARIAYDLVQKMIDEIKGKP